MFLKQKLLKINSKILQIIIKVSGWLHKISVWVIVHSLLIKLRASSYQKYQKIKRYIKNKGKVFIMTQKIATLNL
jgi:hypothetical protein